MRHTLVSSAIWVVLVVSHAAAHQGPAPAGTDAPLSKALAADPRLEPLAADVRAKVLAEADQAQAYCRADMPTRFYDCDCLARKVFDHRFKVGTEIETRSSTKIAAGGFKVPLTHVLADPDLNARPCLDPEALTAWLRSRMPDPRMSDARRACIAERVVAGFQSAPKPGLLSPDPFMRDAIAACAGRD